jgi:Zn-dependent protease
MIFGFPYAVGVVVQIFLHESGHAYAMHRLGIPFSPMVFIPFMGAVIALKEHPRDAYQDAIIAAAGPVAGTIAAGVISIVGHGQQSQLLISLADFGFMVNLFNLLPIGSMYVSIYFFVVVGQIFVVAYYSFAHNAK